MSTSKGHHRPPSAVRTPINNMMALPPIQSQSSKSPQSPQPQPSQSPRPPPSPTTQCCYYGTTAVLPLAETYPTAKRFQHKYTISSRSTRSNQTTAKSADQALQAQKPTSNIGIGNTGTTGTTGTTSNATTTNTSLTMSTFTQRSLQALLRKHAIACRWRNSSNICHSGCDGSSESNCWWRLSLCVGLVVLLLCTIGYFVWLHSLPHGTTAWLAATTEQGEVSATPTAMLTTLVMTRLRTNAIANNDAETKAAVTAWPARSTKADSRLKEDLAAKRQATYDEAKNEDNQDYSDAGDDHWYDEGLLEPNEGVEAAAAVQNLTVLRLGGNDNKLQEEKLSTPSRQWTYTNIVSPTIPPLRQWMSSTTATPSVSTASAALPNPQNQSESESVCRSTTLPMCSGVLDYDLTSSAAAVVQLNDDERIAFEMLAKSNCSARAMEFVCTVLEPECRSTGNMLPPCRRICKAILEACSIVVANSDVLTAIFDCSSYPDSSIADVCEDPTRRRNYCYANEFACEDQTCIPHQWQCDNIKDCVAGDDEDSCLVCDQPDEFRCRSNEKCVPAVQRCDHHDDCFDGSDERSCEDYLYSEDIALDTLDYPPAGADGTVVAFNDAEAPSSLLSKYNELLQSSAFFNRTAQSVDGGVANEDISNIVPSESKAQGFVHFRDSKEIMMTSDSENKLKYSATTRGNRTYHNNNNNSNKSNSSVATSTAKTTSASTILPKTETPSVAAVSDSTKHANSFGSRTCAAHQLRCVSGHCITVQQICDKKIDCPDGADELMCVYKQQRAGSVFSETSGSISTTPSTTSTATSTTSANTTTSSTSTTTIRPLSNDVKRKTAVRKLRGQYQYQQQQQQQQAHG